jgi:RNA polymerase sigma-70 factor (ECF subfamily)
VGPAKGGEAAPDIVSSAALVSAARGGDDAAREALFRRYAGMANGLALRLMGRDSDVDDLVQDTFMQAFSRLDSLRTPEIFGSWLAAIMVGIAHKVLRRRRLLSRLGLRRNEPVDVDALLAPWAPPEVALEARAVYEYIDELPPKLRIPLLLRRVEGMEIADIAAATGASLATVKRRIAEAEDLLRRAPLVRGRA